jgi:hypothetical protein
MLIVLLRTPADCDDPERVIGDNNCGDEGGVSTIIFIGKYADVLAKQHCQRLKTYTN